MERKAEEMISYSKMLLEQTYFSTNLMIGQNSNLLIDLEKRNANIICKTSQNL